MKTLEKVNVPASTHSYRFQHVEADSTPPFTPKANVYKCDECGGTMTTPVTPNTAPMGTLAPAGVPTWLTEQGPSREGRTCTQADRDAWQKKQRAVEKGQRTKERNRRIDAVRDHALSAIRAGADPNELHKQIDLAVILSVHDS